MAPIFVQNAVSASHSQKSVGKQKSAASSTGSEASWSSSSKSSTEPRRGAKPREEVVDLDPYTLAEAMATARQCIQGEIEVACKFSDDVWADAVQLEPVLAFIAQPSFSPPAGFEDVMQTCLACLASNEEGTLQNPKSMSRLLKDHTTENVLKYLSWLEAAVEKVAFAGGGDVWRVSAKSSAKSRWTKEGAVKAVSTWIAECGSLREAAAQLWETLLQTAGESLKLLQEWQKCDQLRQVIQAQQADECARIADEIETCSRREVSTIRCQLEGAWPDLAKTTSESLESMRNVSTILLAAQAKKTSACLMEYNSLDQKQEACLKGLKDKRRQVRKRNEALLKSEKSFTETVRHLIGWTACVLPKVRVISLNTDSLDELIELQVRIPELQREKLEAEDEADAAATEVRRINRRSMACDARLLTGGSTEDQPLTPRPDAMLAKEARQNAAKERCGQIEEELANVMDRHLEVAARIPFAVGELDDDALPGDGKHDKESHEEIFKNIKKIHRRHPGIPPHNLLEKVEALRTRAAVRLAVEPAFLCPLTHKQYTDPVVAVDGFTYERVAIESWMVDSDFSPMTGQTFNVSKLTKNYAMRELVETHSTVLTPRKDVKKMNKAATRGGQTLDEAAKQVERRYRFSVMPERRSSDQNQSNTTSQSRSTAEVAMDDAAIKIQAIVRKSFLAKPGNGKTLLPPGNVSTAESSSEYESDSQASVA